MFFGLLVLSYGLGLRHAVDADHIAVIDNTMRKFIHEGKRPVTIGLFFSLGHASVVILLSLLVAFSASFVQHNLPQVQKTGEIIGAMVSAFFLLAVGLINLISFVDIIKTWEKVVKSNHKEKLIHTHIDIKGIMVQILRPVLKTVHESWHMYVVGFLFGLGFDTASEVGLLSISAASAARGMPVMYILLLPIAFTAGMALVDTFDGILMLGAYGWAYVNPIRKLYYNMNITFISVIIAFFIGGIEALKLLISEFNWKGSIFDFISGIEFGNFGYVIIVAFLLSWIVSIAIYKYKGYDRL